MPGRIPVDDTSVTPIESSDDLPEQEYRVGYFTDTGPGSGTEFQGILNRERSTDEISGELYTRSNDVYAERDLYVRGQDDEQFYDVDPLHGIGGGDLSLSETEKHAESRSTVNDSREI